MFSKMSLTVRMLLITTVVGFIVWAGLANIQNAVLTNLFEGKLSDRFSRQARADRLRFDRYVKAHHQAVKLFTDQHTLSNYLFGHNWLKNIKGEPRRLDDFPAWLPESSVMRDFIHLRYALLMDSNGKTREYYQTNDGKIPHELLYLSPIYLALAHNQAYLTTLNDQPFLIAAETIYEADSTNKATLLLAAPLDDEFLIASQLPSNSGNIIALLSDEDDARILVSSNEKLIEVGKRSSELKDSFLVTGLAFFDYGASDLAIKFASFISTEEVGELTSTIMNRERMQLAATAIIFILAFGLIMLWITQRIHKLTKRVVEFSGEMGLEGDHAIEARGDQIRILEQRFLSLSQEVQRETEALEHQATHDPLTGLPNRIVLHKKIKECIRQYEDNGRSAALLIMDLDGFKEINDTLGHNIGDMMLVEVGKRIRGDTAGKDTVARLGGDEFAVLLPGDDGEGSRHLANRLVQTIEKPFMVNKQKLNVGVSIGIAVLPDHGTDNNTLIQHADVAMYVAKRVKCGFAVYDPSQDQHSLSRLELKSELQHAIEHGQLELRYQPQVHIESGIIRSVEALTRWHHPTRGLVLPDEFIPLAEQTGLVTPLTTWLLRQAIEQATNWQKQGLDLTVSVNLSVRCLHNAALVENVRQTLAEFGLESRRLMIEITENAIMADPARVQRTLKDLSQMGVRLSIDDFGTGHSSLSYLKSLPVNELKIDKSFVMEMADDENDAMIVHATIDLAHNLGLRVVAEGVESEDTWKLLKDLQCDLAQGYYLSVAITNDKLMELPNKTPWRLATQTAAVDTRSRS